MYEESKMDAFRKQVATVDKFRRLSEEAERARLHVLRGNRVATRKVGFLTKLTYDRSNRFEAFSPELSDALVLAFARIRDEYNKEADLLAAEIEAGLHGKA